MTHDNNKNLAKPEDAAKPAAATGNASNPSPGTAETKPVASQLLDYKAEKYLQEVANIEDVPDAQDQEDMDETMKRENRSNE